MTINEPTGTIGEFTIPAEDMAAPIILQHKKHDTLGISANILRWADDARQVSISRIEWGKGNYHSE